MIETAILSFKLLPLIAITFFSGIYLGYKMKQKDLIKETKKERD